MDDSIVSIKGLNKADVLAALYNASKPQGAGFMDFDPHLMAREEAAELLSQEAEGLQLPYRLYFDYVKGRVMKIEFGFGDANSDVLTTRLYDRDNGPGAAARAIEDLWERLTRPDTESACCPTCAGAGTVSNREAERWADERRAEMWRREGRLPPAEDEVDGMRFQQVEVAEAQARVEVDVATRDIEIETVVEDAKPLTPVDVTRFRRMGQRPQMMWEVFIRGRPAFPRVQFPSRKEALAVASRTRRLTTRGVMVGPVAKIEPETVEGEE